MLKTSVILLSLSLLAFATYPVFAQELTPKAIRPVVKSQLVQERIETKRENLENRIEVMREKLASKAAALKLKLQAFKDTKKAEIAERVSANLNKINQNRTTQMQKHLDRMSEILDKLEARVNSGTPDIKGSASASAAIASARDAIASASAAVSDQALKDYTIVVTSESNIRIDAKTQRDKLHTDLLALRKIVIDAKQAVANAIRVAKSGKALIPGLRKEGTSSGQ